MAIISAHILTIAQSVITPDSNIIMSGIINMCHTFKIIVVSTNLILHTLSSLPGVAAILLK